MRRWTRCGNGHCWVAGLVGLAAAVASGAPFTWSGLGGNDHWGTSANWVEGLPAIDGTADIVLAGTVRLTPNVDIPWSINKLTFNNTAGAFVVGGSPLTLGAGGILQSDGDTQTINNAIAVGTAQTWTRSNGALVINGNLSGSGTVTINSSATAGIQLGGDNAGFSGAINLFPSSQNLVLLRPAAMPGGGIVFGGSGANSNLFLSGSGNPGTYSMGVGAGAGQLAFRGSEWGGVAPLGGDVVWDPGIGGDYALSASTIDFGPTSSGNPVIRLGSATGSLLLTGGHRTINGVTGSGTHRVPAATAIFDFALGDDGSARNLTFAGSHVVLTRAATVGNLGGATTISSNGSLAISSFDQIFAGNLNLGSSGILLLDNLSWADFTSARAYGTGANQWQFNGGGFAARGADLVIDSNPAGFSWDNRNFALGSASIVDGQMYADHKVDIAVPIMLGSDAGLTRSLKVMGGAYQSLSNWTILGVANEISGQLSGTVGILDITGLGSSNWTAGGMLRLSHPGNDFVGTIQIRQGAVVSVASDGVFGHGGNLVRVMEGPSGSSGMLLFEGASGGGATVFAKPFEINATSDASGGRSGFGGAGGQAIYTGTVAITGHNSKNQLPVHVREGATLQLGQAGAPATLQQDRGTAMTYNKGGAGELVLGNLIHTGATPGYKWTLQEGTLTTTANGQLSSGNVAWTDLVQTTSLERTWRIATASQTYANMTTGQFNQNMDIRVDAGLTLATSMAGGQLLSTPSFTTNVLRKTGPGTWIYYSANAPAGHGSAGWIQVEEGVFEVTGNLGNTGLRLSGGTILSGTSSSFATADRAFQIGVEGGKIGLASTAAGDVSRGGTVVWSQGVAPVTLAARDNYNLIFANTSFPDVAAGSTLLIERDGAGLGRVQINDAAVTISGTIGGSGTLRIGSAGAGSLAVVGTLSPGSSPGTLTIEGNLAMADYSIYAWELTRDTQYDSVAIVGSLSLGDNLILQLSGAHRAAAGNQYTLFTWTGDGPSGATNWILDYSQSENLMGGWVVTDLLGKRIYLTGLIPEPSTALLLLAAAGLSARRRGADGRRR